MAKAKRIPLAPPPPQFDVELILTAKEATNLMTLLYAIGGDPKTTIRSEIDAVRNALYEGGVRPGVSLNQSFYL